MVQQWITPVPTLCRRQYIRSTEQDMMAMARAKSVTLTLRTTPEIKELLRQAAEREHRSIASMVEILIIQYAKVAKLGLRRASKTVTAA